MIRPSELLTSVANAITQTDCGLKRLRVYDGIAQSGLKNWGQMLDTMTQPEAVLRYAGLVPGQAGNFVQHRHQFELALLLKNQVDAMDVVQALIDGRPASGGGLTFEQFEIDERCDPITDVSLQPETREIDGIEYWMLRFALQEKGMQ